MPPVPTILPPPFGVPAQDPLTRMLAEPWRRYYLSLNGVLAPGIPPVDAPYWVSTNHPVLTHEVNLGARPSGYLRLTTALGVGTPSTVATIPPEDLTPGGTLPPLDGRHLTNLPAHAPRHQLGGDDPLSVLTLAGYPGGTATFLRADGVFAAPTGGTLPGPHASTHAATGGDPVSVLTLAGYPGVTTTFLRGDGIFAAVPANAPLAHASTHQPGGSDPMAVDAVAATGSLRTLGSGAQQAASGTDPRFTNARPPTAHASTHWNGSADALSVLQLAGYPGGTAAFLRADGVFAAPSGGVPGAHHASHEPGGSDPLANVAWTHLLNTFTALGVHLFSAAGTGFNSLRVVNTAAGSGNGAQFLIGTDQGVDTFGITVFSSTYSGSAEDTPGGAKIRCRHTGGLSLVADIGTIRFYTTSSERWRIDTAGDLVSTTNASGHLIRRSGDTGFFDLCGGSGTTQASGAYLRIAGTTSAAQGSIQAVLGAHASAVFSVTGTSGSSLVYRCSDGHATLTAAGTNEQARFVNTDSLGGYLTWRAATTDYGHVGSAYRLGTPGSGGTDLGVTAAVGALALESRSGVIRFLAGGGERWQIDAAGHLVANPGAAIMRRVDNTGDVDLCGGSGPSAAQGAYLRLGGVAGAAAGGVTITLGSHASANFTVNGSSGSLQMLPDGRTYFASSHLEMMSINSTNASGSYVRWQLHGGTYAWLGGATVVQGINTSTDFGIRATKILGFYSDNQWIEAPPVWNATAAAAANVLVADAAGRLMRATSSLRHKTGVSPLPDWRWILDLRPISFLDRNAPTGRRYGGLSAEDVAAHSPRGEDGRPLFAGLDAAGQPDDVAYTHMIAPLVAAIQALDTRLRALEEP
jgi:hypothetical protein